MTNLAIPTTENPEWGFFGTMSRQASASPTDAAWDAALTAIVAATACTPDEACIFLDSRYGRNFADDVSGYLLVDRTVGTAIESAVTRWMGWTITRATSRTTGIPTGLPYLTGFVGQAAIEIEAEAGTKVD
ncbi:MAG: hypothetical protein WDN25_24925 [Acetobacteraceae bacterium]